MKHLLQKMLEMAYFKKKRHENYKSTLTNLLLRPAFNSQKILQVVIAEKQHEQKCKKLIKHVDSRNPTSQQERSNPQNEI